MDDLLAAVGIQPPARTPHRVTERMALRGRRVLAVTKRDNEWVWVENLRAISDPYWDKGEGRWHVRFVPEKIWYEWDRTNDVRVLDDATRSYPMYLMYVEAAELVPENTNFVLPEGALPTGAVAS